MKHVTIGSAGAAGHGKTSLLKALGATTSSDAVRGVSASVEYSLLKLPDGTPANVVETRGDAAGLDPWISGAAAMDIFLMVVAADAGIDSRTREQFQILSLLGIEHGAIAITKIDLVAKGQTDALLAGIRAMTAGTPLAQAPIFRVSSVTRQGVNALRRALQSTASRLPARNASLPVRMVIDGSSNADQHTVLTGILASGTIRVGDTVEILPRRQTPRVRWLDVDGTRAKTAEAGMRVSVSLDGVDAEGIAAGSQLVAPGSLRTTTAFDAALRLLPGAALPRNGAPVRIWIGAADVLGTMTRLGQEADGTGAPDDIFVHVETDAEIAGARGDRFILRDGENDVTLGGGVLLDVAASGNLLPAANTVESLTAKRRGMPEDLLETLLQAEPLGISRRSLYEKSGLRPEVAEAGLRILLERGNTVVLPGERLFARSSLAAITERARTLLETYHAQFPTRPGMPRLEFRSALEPNAADPGLRSNVFSALLSHWKRQDVVSTEGPSIRLKSFQPALNERQKSLLQRIEAIYRDYGIAFPPIDEVSRQVNAPPDAINALLKWGVETGRFIKIEEGVFYHRETVAELRRLVEETIAESGSFTVGAFRDLAESNRRYAMLILEYFDEIRFTRRDGDTRTLYTAAGDKPAQ